MEFNEEKFEQEIFKQRYSMIKKREIREAVDKYKSESSEESKYIVLKSNVHDKNKSKELYSLSKSFNDWKDAENYASTVEHSIIVDTEKKCEVKNSRESE